MTQKILITGSTGTLGRLVLPGLQKTGAEIRTLSRSEARDGGEHHFVADMLTGEGLAQAIDGVDVVVHLAGAAAGDERIAENLVAAARAAGSPHILAMSVVGADLVPQRSWLDRKMFGYFGAKQKAEAVIRGSGLNWTILRATQFHQLLIPVMAAMVRLPVVPVPAGFRFQPIDAGEVADRMLELATTLPVGQVSSIAGPKAMTMLELVSSYLAAIGMERPLLRIPMPGAAARALRHGVNLDLQHAVGRIGWGDALRLHLQNT